MGSKFRTSFEMEIDVEFVDPEAAKTFFIEGDWRDFFWNVEDLEELVPPLAFGFHDTFDKISDEKTWGRFVEGFGFFEKHEDGTYHRNETSSNGGGGQIIVRYEQELDAFQTDEIKDKEAELS